jgi:hypothetical protein
MGFQTRMRSHDWLKGRDIIRKPGRNDAKNLTIQLPFYGTAVAFVFLVFAFALDEDKGKLCEVRDRS